MSWRALLAGSLILPAAGAFWFYHRARSQPLNLLVVSACSARLDRFGVYNPASKLTPQIDAWARDAFVFTDAVSELPWQNFSQYARGKVAFTVHALVPPLRMADSGHLWWDEKDTLEYKREVQDFGRRLSRLAARPEPFAAFVHLKYMHFPHFDDLNMGEREWQRLTPAARARLESYRANPEIHAAKLPLIELLFNRFDLLKSLFNLKGQVFSAAGVISDPVRTATWRRTEGFLEDVRLARDLYDLKMEKFDDHAAQVLNLFGNKEMQDRTVVVFTGDHGEALMDHGVLGHSVNLYEEMIRYPLMVKFPGARGQVRLDGQVNHAAMVEIVSGILAGEIDAGNLAAEVKRRELEFAVSRNCMSTIRSVRFNGAWKFIQNLDSGKGELYDLKADPGETRDMAEANPEMAWKLEEHLMSQPLPKSTSFGRRPTPEAMVCTAD